MIYHNMWAGVYSLPACLMMFVSESDVRQQAAIEEQTATAGVVCLEVASGHQQMHACTFASQLALAVWISLLAGACSS